MTASKNYPSYIKFFNFMLAFFWASIYDEPCTYMQRYVFTLKIFMRRPCPTIVIPAFRRDDKPDF